MASFYPARKDGGPVNPAAVASSLRSGSHRQEVIARRLDAPPLTEAQKTHRSLVAKDNTVEDVLRIAHDLGDKLDGSSVATAVHKVAQIYRSPAASRAGGGLGAYARRDAVWRDERFTELLARGVSECASEWRPRQLCHMVWSLAILTVSSHSPYLPPLCASFGRVIAEGVPQDISTVAWALASIAFCDAAIMEAIVKRCKDRAAEFCPQDLSITAWSFAKLIFAESRSAMPVIATESLRQLAAFSGRNLANLSWAFATMQERDLALYQGLVRELTNRLPELGPQELPITLWSLAAVSYPADDVFLIAATTAPTLYKGMDASHICNVAWAFARAGPRDLPFFDSLAAEASVRATQLEPLHIANLAWAFATVSKLDEIGDAPVGIRNERLFEVLARSCERQSAQLVPQHFSTILWAFGACKVDQGVDLVANVASTNVRHCLEQYEPRHISGMIWAMAELQLKHDTLGAVLLEAAARGGLAGLARDGPAHLSAIAWSAVKLTYVPHPGLQNALSAPADALYSAMAGSWQELSEGRRENLATLLRSLYKMDLGRRAKEMLGAFEASGVHPGLEAWGAWLFGAAETDDVELEVVAPTLFEQTATLTKEMVNGRRILISTSGSRGDVQPFVALALGLKSAGYTVKIITNCNHAPLVKSFGVDVFGVSADAEKVLRENESLRTAMAKGEFTTFASALDEIFEKLFPQCGKESLQVWEEFHPDLVIASILDVANNRCIAYAKDVPFVACFLQNSIPTQYEKSPLNEPDWLPKRCRVMVGFLLSYLISLGDAKKIKIIREELKVPGSDGLLDTFLQQMYTMSHPELPPIVGTSTTLQAELLDMPEDGKPIFTGPWVINAKEQEAQARAGGDLFGTKESTAALKAFLADGKKPVYMGWGSMIAISPEYMTRFAVRVLMKTGHKGIVLGGFAHLAESMLDGEPELQRYAKDNVLFVDTAAHEALFPHCSLLVHHGGMGTTAAAYRSGVPQVVTPVFLDQFVNADMVTKTGVGFGLPQFQKCSAEAVCKAVQSCLSDASFSQNAQEKAAQMRAEDGVANAVKAVEAAFKEVDSGEWRQKQDANKAILRKLASRRTPSCFSWIYRACCMSKYNDYHGWVA